MPIPIVYKYHCEPATKEDSMLLQSQIRLASEYRSELARIENRARALQRSRISPEILSGIKDLRKDPELTKKAIEIMRDAICAIAQGDDQRSCEASSIPSEISSSTTRSGTIDRLVAIGIPVAIAPTMFLRAQLLAAQSEAQRAARSRAVDLGLHWGTYQDSEEAVSSSCRTTPIADDVRTFSPRDVGCAAVHLQPARSLRGQDDAWIQISPPDQLMRRGSEIDRSGRVRPARHRMVRLRVGTQEGRTPIWASLFVLMHRELPSGVVSWARVKRRRVGATFRWEIHVTIAPSDARSARPAGERRAATVGVDIGWRQFADRTRIAYWWGSDGRSGEVAISNAVLSADAKSDSLRAIRDNMKNEIRGKLQAFCAALRKDPRDESAWFVEATLAMHSWLKTWRFVRLANEWKGRRFPGDETMHDEVAAWLKQDRHLWNWGSFGREKRKRRVDEQIRLLAVQLGREYERIGIEKPMVAKLVQKAERCEACQSQARRCAACAESERMRRLASTRVPHATPARTRQEIKTFGARYGAMVIELNAAYTTMDCAACGHRRDDVKDWSKLDIECSACQVKEDQDRTAAKNLAKRASDLVLGPDGKPLASENGEDPGAQKRKLGARRNRKAPKVDRSQLT